MVSKQSKSEQELAAVVVEWLLDHGWDVYQEVRVRRHGPIADIIATKDTDLWIIETKTSMSVRLIDQAKRWMNSSGLVSIAVPSVKAVNKTRLHNKRELRRLGIGLLEISWHGSVATVREVHRSRKSLSMLPYEKRVWESLHQGHQHNALAGSPRGGYWTPYKDTCRNILNFVTSNPGCTVHDVIENIDTHYRNKASAYSSIHIRIKQGLVPGVRRQRDGRVYRLYLDSEGEHSGEV